ncbi:hypothetical protein CTKA_02384 [Chthonomonas calidirosea]|uniref:HNH endonuclease n=1 Tax=Chthonomonas calidirosea (strain DSM 23976 / ICMP 18418 / T49) TaxID=1303518 RepID=S0EYM4_CHTCT|nr:hypothetical protein [Chthonomonas calidirosea]CCW35524.1 hypothetical protein CCALI_01711 [Chthonomonas calidirosea T49]CEK20016.1 hypothetical protein CTKA_02384 [Chthonomonas calidirosea]
MRLNKKKIRTGFLNLARPFEAWGAYSLAFAFLLAGCGGHPRTPLSSPAGLPNSVVEADRSQYAQFLPNPQLTPGDALPVTVQDICTPGYARKVRNVPVEVKRQVYQEYGIYHHQPGEYEIDHLISLELGGSNSIKNLWPQSYITRPWNAHIKDQLENELHREVCSGEMDLAVAQHDIATDWIATYKQVFHTDRPLSPQEYRQFMQAASGRTRAGFAAPVATTPAPVSTPDVDADGAPSTPSNGVVRVWVNTRSGKYFLPGSRYYGNTKRGEYMTEDQAIRQGYVKAGGE